MIVFKPTYFRILLITVLVLFLNCTKNDDTLLDPEITEEVPDTPEEIEEETNSGNNEGEAKPKAGEVELFKNNQLDNSYLLVNDARNNQVYLMDKSANIVHEWELKTGLGNDCYLEDSGKLLALVESTNPQITFGGFGGNLQLINPDNSVAWEYKISNDNMISHHDAEMLPNGNIIVLVWMKIQAEEAMKNGFQQNYDIYPESVFEINPATNKIVWQWNSWDHIIQDVDSDLDNFGEIAENPRKIDINYNPNESGDIMHANGLSYDSKNDLIYLSINFYSEIWVIDHSTTTEEAASSIGGKYNYGGDLVYRFGNPEVYKNTKGNRTLFNNHYPNINDTQNTMLLYMNGNSKFQSTVYEFKFPEVFTLLPNTNNEPEIIWSFTDPELYSPKVSGAVELPNGNILITEGDFGAWEVNRNGEVVWKFKGDGFFWRIYPYSQSNPALSYYNFNS